MNIVVRSAAASWIRERAGYVRSVWQNREGDRLELWRIF